MNFFEVQVGDIENRWETIYGAPFVKYHIFVMYINLLVTYHILVISIHSFVWDTWESGTMESRVVWTVDLRNSLVLSCKKNPPETTEANTIMDLKYIINLIEQLVSWIKFRQNLKKKKQTKRHFGRRRHFHRLHPYKKMFHNKKSV